jgi:hypothetical protein
MKAIILKMEAEVSSETSVSVSQTKRHIMPDNRNLNTHRQDKHKSHLWIDVRVFTLKMEAACSSETLVSVYQTTKRHMPEVTNFNTNHSENLKSHMDRRKGLHPEDGGSRFLRCYTASHISSSGLKHSMKCFRPPSLRVV